MFLTNKRFKFILFVSKFLAHVLAFGKKLDYPINLMDSLETRTWGPEPSVLYIESEECFSSIRESIQEDILLTMRNHHYNTLDSFVNLHNQYQKQGNTKSLEDLRYWLPVSYEGDGTSCVGLSLQFIKYYSKSRPDIASYLYLITGDEYPEYARVPIHQNTPSPQVAWNKGHVLVGLEFLLMERRGYFLIDLGLALDLPVIVMRDGQAPQTGIFSQLSRIGSREYVFQMTEPDSSYVIWKIRELRGNEVVVRRRFLYVGRPFLCPDELERRNWYYHYRGKVFLGPGGVRAGMYIIFGEDSRRLTFFVTEESNVRLSTSFPCEYFLNYDSVAASEMSSEDQHIFESFSMECGLSGIKELLSYLAPICSASCDDHFVKQMLKINEKLVTVLNSDMM